MVYGTSDLFLAKAAKERQEAAAKEVKKEEPKEEVIDLEKPFEEILAILKANRIQLSCEIKLADFKKLVELNILAKKPEMPECVIQ